MPAWGDFTGLNRGYVLELYEKYRRDPSSVDADTRAALRAVDPARLGRRRTGAGRRRIRSTRSSARSTSAQSIRRYGHLAAQARSARHRAPVGDPSLRPETHGVTERRSARACRRAWSTAPLGEAPRTCYEPIEALRAIYCSTTGYDFAHVFVPEERDGCAQAVETRPLPRRRPIRSTPVALLDRLTQVEAFERFLHRTFPGKTRFSIEGLDMLVPILDEIIADAAEAGIRHVLIGMAHRGRLNVLAHVLQKPYAQILAEFKDPVFAQSVRSEDMGWTGDVKYHAGARRAIEGGARDRPGRLDAAQPEPPRGGRSRSSRAWRAPPARRSTRRARRASIRRAALPILIHGDAAFPGQGVVAETLNLSRLAGYDDRRHDPHHRQQPARVHRPTPSDAYSTSYASGLARGFKIPIVHVNADDPEACVEAARLALRLPRARSSATS